MRREYHRWFSPALGRDMELLAFGHAGPRVLVFPTRCGRFYDYENWGLVESARDRLASGSLHLFCVDSVDAESWYNPHVAPADRVRRHGQYERYLLDEVVPLTRAVNPDPGLVAHGCSMGAYHAVNLALRHPGLFGRVAAFSGRYDLTTPVGDFRDLLDGHYDPDVYFHTPTHFLPGLGDEGVLDALRRVCVTLTVGEADPFADNTRRLSEALWAKGVFHHLHVWPGRAHKPAHWQRMQRLYL